MMRSDGYLGLLDNRIGPRRSYHWIIGAMLIAVAWYAMPDARADEARRWEIERSLGRGDAATAARLIEVEVKEMSAARGERDPQTLIMISNLAYVYGALGRHAEELALNDKALKLHLEIFGERDPATLSVMHGLARTYRDLGRYAEARALNEKVLKLRTQILGERDTDTLASMSSVAIGYGDVGHYAEAVALNERALKLGTQVFGVRHSFTLRSINNLSASYSDVGRYVEALGLRERALELSVSLHGERHPTTFIMMEGLASLYDKLGWPAQALALDENVVKLRTEILGQRNPATLRSMNNLARTYRALGRHAEALSLDEKVLRLRSEVLGERHPDTLRSMNNLGQTYGAMGYHAEALAMGDRALKLRREVLGERHRDTLSSMSNLAASYGDVGRHTEALALSTRARDLSIEVFGLRDLRTLTSANNVAAIYGVLGRHFEALTLNKMVLESLTHILGERHPETLASVGNLAANYAALGRPGDAAALSARYIAGAEWQRSQPGLSGENRRGIFQAYARGYRHFSLYNGTTGNFAEGFRLSELSKARTLLESMSAQRAARSGALPASEHVVLDGLDRQIATYDQLIAQAKNAEASQNLDAGRNVLVRQYEALVTRLKQQYPRFAQLREPALIDAGKLRGLISPDAVVVSYVSTGNQTSAWIVDASGVPRFVDLGGVPHLADAVEILRRASSYDKGLRAMLAGESKSAWRLTDGSFRLLDAKSSAPQGATALTDEAEVGLWLSAKLLAPLQSHLAGKTQWIISPDGVLAQLPFDLLKFGGARVLDTVQLHYTQSLSVYALAKARAQEYRGLRRAKLRRAKELLAFGNPDYASTSSPGDTSRQARRVQLRSRPVLAESQLKDLRSWNPLPGTEKEIQALRKLLPRSDVYLAQDASEARLLALNASGALKNYRYLHFAAHGLLSTDDPALSSLVLAQRNLAPGTDGYVTAAEWLGYELRSDLTVLSACETGLGRQLAGEGVMGLPFALFIAGNVNTLLTLWAVYDDVTEAFMTRFYARLAQGMPAARALTETKRELAASKDPVLRHPSSWAGFVLVGAG